MSWKTPPKAVGDSEIAYVHNADVVVIGLGYSGSAALRAAQESGAHAIGIELMPSERYTAFGRDVGHINSSFLRSRGVPSVDPIDLFNEWMRRAGNRANPGLVMKFCKKSGEAFDWYTDMYGIEGLDAVHIAFWPDGSEKFKAEAKNNNFILNGYSFWTGTAEFPDPMGWPGKPTLPDCARANLDKACQKGAEIFYGTQAMQLVSENGRVTGVIGMDKDGSFHKFTGKRGVILATGDFAGNQDMLLDLCCDITDLLVPGQELARNPGRNGRGIQMGVWAGGRLETRPLPTMGGNGLNIQSLCGFGAVWLGPDGKRFCNEVFGGTEIVGFAGNQNPPGTIYCVFDEHCLENELQWAVPAHGGFDANLPGAVENLKNLLDWARSSKETKFEIKLPPPVGKKASIYVGSTPEELVQNAVLDSAVADNVIKSIRRYNEICAAGRDDDFGRERKLLDPLTDTLFLQPVTPLPWGGMLVTVGGLVTDDNQQVMDANYQRIGGLFATGNCCGRRFGSQYFTPIAGVSIGMAITLGREAGIAAATLRK